MPMTSLAVCLHAKSVPDLVMTAAIFLESQGWKLAPPGDGEGRRHWESRAAFCQRVGISHRTLRRRIREAQKRGKPEVKVEHGRIFASLAFEEWARLG